MHTIYIAHRGSKVNGGVENTKDAFLGGVKAKAQGLECDVRVTKDGKFIICHDDTLERLTQKSKIKYDLNVNLETFDKIKDIKLSQEYNNTVYEGVICTFEEYLAICYENNMIPIIELKWTNGMYSNNQNDSDFDYGNLDKLVELIKKHHLFDVAYVMTSMRGCLQYLRNHYPSLKLQWLCSTNVLEHINWCIQNNISVDVEHNSCTKELVDICHAHNLVVNIWTMNDEALLKKYLDMQVDMITSDFVIK